eukprot:scaffold314115_cov41-Tisochrysis_lutea.AAC.1
MRESPRGERASIAGPPQNRSPPHASTSCASNGQATSWPARFASSSSCTVKGCVGIAPLRIGIVLPRWDNRRLISNS